MREVRSYLNKFRRTRDIKHLKNAYRLIIFYTKNALFGVAHSKTNYRYCSTRGNKKKWY